MFLSALEDPDFGFGNVTPLTMLAHFQDKYGTMSPEELERNCSALSEPWNFDAPMEDLLVKIAYIQHLVLCRKVPNPNITIITLTLAMIEKTGLLSTITENSACVGSTIRSVFAALSSIYCFVGLPSKTFPPDSLGIADSGSTAHFCTLTANVRNKRPTITPIGIANPKGTVMFSIRKAELDNPSLPGWRATRPDCPRHHNLVVTVDRAT